MFCNACGRQNPDGAAFCAGCGAPMGQPQQQPQTFYAQPQPQPPYPQPQPAYPQPQWTPYNANPVGKLTEIFAGPLYLVMCILVTATALLSLIGAFTANPAAVLAQVLPILFVIFMWLVYGSAKQGAVQGKRLRLVSGALFAQVIINWIGVGLFAFLGLICMTMSSVIRDLIAESSPTYYYYFQYMGMNLTALAVFVGVVLLVAAVLLAVFNACGFRSMHKLSKSMYQSADSGVEDFQKLGAARGWIMAFGIMYGLEALVLLSASATVNTQFSYGSYSYSYDYTASTTVNIFSVLSVLCMAVVFILAFVLLGKLKNKVPQRY